MSIFYRQLSGVLLQKKLMTEKAKMVRIVTIVFNFVPIEKIVPSHKFLTGHQTLNVQLNFYSYVY